MSAEIDSLSVMYREKALDRTKIPPSARYRDNILVRLNRVGADGETPQEAPERAQGAYAVATGLTFTVENCSETIALIPGCRAGMGGTGYINTERQTASFF